MKMLATMTSILLVSAVPAFAQDATATLSDVQKAEIGAMVPNADLNNLSDDQVVALQTALHSGTDAEQRRRVHAVLARDSMSYVDLTDQERSAILTMFPGADLYYLTQEQVNGLKAALNSGSDSDTRENVQAALGDSMVTDAELTDVQRAEIKTLVPTAELDGLSDDQIVGLQLALNSGSDSDQRQEIRAILQ